jgi:hypothetical protein
MEFIFKKCIISLNTKYYTCGKYFKIRPRDGIRHWHIIDTSNGYFYTKYYNNKIYKVEKFKPCSCEYYCEENCDPLKGEETEFEQLFGWVEVKADLELYRSTLKIDHMIEIVGDDCRGYGCTIIKLNYNPKKRNIRSMNASDKKLKSFLPRI